ncbi:molybdenum cofactor guanylyltransferase [Acinetobacter sp. MD2(2019)]|uniref:molybdenum cofactor guanylyltransferase n=1 Tax=Acinetobacter sp. MD2(2019) TaxID=2605273 RepID=UPI002D1E5E7B|nr:molybdenum cofactor guanylyltransferase [Acinetobacter sp. MD2(2019)]MEB3752796.1 molybdenum cofactor guanylyltransferase [Acinetobacter sp. MD2(2019)]
MVLGGLVLAGGQGLRMGGQNKGLIPFRNGDLIDPMLALLKAECAYVAVSANQDIQRYQQKQVDVWFDVAPWKNCGPLGGVYSSCLQFPAEVDLIQVLPCDSPFISKQVLQTLFNALTSKHLNAVYAKTSTQIYPVIFLFKRDLLPHLNHFLSTEKKHSIRRWLSQVHAEAVLFEDESYFVNMNDIKTLESYRVK